MFINIMNVKTTFNYFLNCIINGLKVTIISYYVWFTSLFSNSIKTMTIKLFLCTVIFMRMNFGIFYIGSIKYLLIIRDYNNNLKIIAI